MGILAGFKEARELPNGVYLVKENLDGSGCGTLEVPYHSARERDRVITTLALK